MYFFQAHPYLDLIFTENFLPLVLQESGPLLQTEQHLTKGDGNYWVVYGDPAYPISPQVVRPFQEALLTPEQSAFNSQIKFCPCVC